jgi:hypothetical protein
MTSRLLQLADTHAPHWASDKLRPFPEENFQRIDQFRSQYHWQSCGSINLFRVVGTRHPDYVGLTWREFLEQGKRMPGNHRLWESNPGYYEGTDPKPPTISYISVDGISWYVDGDGNHRTAIGRYHSEIHGQSGWFHGVELVDVRIDQAFVDAMLNAQSAAAKRGITLSLEHHRETVKREDGPGWKVDHYRHWCRIRCLPARWRRSFPEGTDLDAEGLRELTLALESHGLRRWLCGRRPGAGDG